VPVSERVRLKMACRSNASAASRDWPLWRVPWSTAARDAVMIGVLYGMVAKHPRWGFWKCFDRMRIE
jgi:putative transposase